MSQEEVTPFGAALDAIENGDVAGLRDALRRDPTMLCEGEGDGHLFLSEAAERNHIPLLAALVEAGADINEGHSEDSPEGPIEAAAAAGAQEAVQWLLDRGAKINFQLDRGTRCFALVGAVRNGHFAVVKLLVERGADFNAVWGGRNALSWAIETGRQEIADYLRSKGALEPHQLASWRAAPRSAIRRHLEQHLGALHPQSLQEIVSSSFPLTIHRIDLPDRHVLVTEGMSARPMSVPDGKAEYQHAELLINLPRGWPLDDLALQSAEAAWPILWLRRIARYPHDHGTWLGGDAVVFANGEPPEPLAPNTNLSCLLALTEESEFGWLRLPDRVIAFYSLYPLYTEERDLERQEGVARLLQLFQEHDISPTVDLHRVNVVSRM